MAPFCFSAETPSGAAGRPTESAQADAIDRVERATAGATSVSGPANCSADHAPSILVIGEALT
jgi:hypothetical protein